jgi:hypothetical protein
MGSDTTVTYELWEMRSGNLVGSWSTETEALAVVRDALNRHSADAFASLSLLAEDAQGETTVVAEGLALIHWAQTGTPARDQRSACPGGIGQ